MSTLRHVIAVVLLALWLPATQHCGLEAAGLDFLTHEDHASSTCRDTCTDDACHNIEGISFTKEVNSLRALPAPVADFCYCLIHLVTPPAVEDVALKYSAGDSPELQVLHGTWSFARRTSLPARAPDFVA